MSLSTTADNGAPPATTTTPALVPGEATAPTEPDVRDEETTVNASTAAGPVTNISSSNNTDVADVVAAALADHLSGNGDTTTTTVAGGSTTAAATGISTTTAEEDGSAAAFHGLVDCAASATPAKETQATSTAPTKLPPSEPTTTTTTATADHAAAPGLDEKKVETTTAGAAAAAAGSAALPPPSPATPMKQAAQQQVSEVSTTSPPSKPPPPPLSPLFDPNSEPTVDELMKLRTQVSRKRVQVANFLDEINAHTVTIKKLKRQYKEAKQTRAAHSKQKQKQQQQRVTANTPRPTKVSHDPSNPATSSSADVGNIKVNVQYGSGTSKTGSKLREQKWKEKFQELVAYKLQHGDCIVPKSYKNKSLHHWVRKQRVCKKDFDSGICGPEAMTQERIDALESIGFAWHVGHQPKDAQWDANFQELLQFRQRHGHFRIPATQAKLHKWVLNQRCRRRLLEQKGEGQARGMTWARVEKLNAIGFVWDGKKGY